MQDIPEKYRPRLTKEFFHKLLDDSYGQFVFSQNKDILVFSSGMIQLFGSDDTPYFGNCIQIFTYEERFSEWMMPFRYLVVEDLYVKDVAFRQDTVKRITSSTKNFMKQFAAVIDSLEKVEKLANAVKDTQPR